MKLLILNELHILFVSELFRYSEPRYQSPDLVWILVSGLWILTTAIAILPALQTTFQP